MSQQSYLIFELSDTFYGIPTTAVQEVFLLPEVTPTAEACPGIIGIVNLRGEILPIVDLHYLLGQSFPPLQLSDSIVVVQWQEQQVGMIVQQVCEVQTIELGDIQTTLPYQQSLESTATPLTAGIAKLESSLVTLINPAYVVELSLVTVNRELTDGNEDGLAIAPIRQQINHRKATLYNHLSTETQHILQARAQNLSQKLNDRDDNGLMPLAILKLEGEYFGVGLELVHELIDIRRLTPIPCCPQHILGNMNLRGEIITLIDISHVLNLLNHGSTNRQRAIVAQWNHSNIGIAVDDIVEVTELDPGQILPVPAAHYSTNDEYFQGVASYQGGMMSIINLSKVITANALIVDEEI